MSCFMGYNPLVAKEVKITTWIKEFDGDSPVYPSFPNEGDCFVVFATDEDALTHNALSKKTYTNGDWADAEGGGGGGGDLSTAQVEVTVGSKCRLSIPFAISLDEYNFSSAVISESGTYQVVLYKGMAIGTGSNIDGDTVAITVTGDAEAEEESVYVTGDCTISVST